MNEELMSQIWTIFKDIFDEDDTEETLGKSLEDVGINSLSLIKFVVAVEEEFDVEVEDQYLDVNQFKLVGDIFKVIVNLIEQKK